MSKKVVISLDVLNSMAVQRTMLTLPVAELENQTFKLDDVLITSRDKQGEVPDLGSINDNIMFVKAKYVNVETKKAVVIPIRGLLSVQVARLAADAAGTGKNAKKANFVKGATPTMTVSDHIVENAADGELTLPAEFTVVGVENRKPFDGSNKPMYPNWYYAAWDAKVAEIAKAGGEPSEIYTDRAFQATLQGTALSPRYKSAEAIKEITIAI